MSTVANSLLPWSYQLSIAFSPVCQSLAVCFTLAEDVGQLCEMRWKRDALLSLESGLSNSCITASRAHSHPPMKEIIVSTVANSLLPWSYQLSIAFSPVCQSLAVCFTLAEDVGQLCEMRWKRDIYIYI